jgi:hypothetical protein
MSRRESQFRCYVSASPRPGGLTRSTSHGQASVGDLFCPTLVQHRNTWKNRRLGAALSASNAITDYRESPTAGCHAPGCAYYRRDSRLRMLLLYQLLLIRYCQIVAVVLSCLLHIRSAGRNCAITNHPIGSCQRHGLSLHSTDCISWFVFFRSLPAKSTNPRTTVSLTYRLR